jgi:hypothetical protein
MFTIANVLHRNAQANESIIWRRNKYSKETTVLTSPAEKGGTHDLTVK